VKREKAHYGVATLCRVLGISTSGYWAWLEREPSTRARRDAELLQRIRVIHKASRGTYGVPRIHAQLHREGVQCSRKRVARLMRHAGLEGCHRRRFKLTTRPRQGAELAPDLVNRVFAVDAPNRLWLSDITYVPTDEGFLYVATVLDAFSRRVVGWSMSEHLYTELVLNALDMAVENRRPVTGVVFHSDHGCQYTSIAFGRRCREVGIAPSMGRVGDAYDNAMAESFFATLECELIDRQHFHTREEARREVFSFVEGFYNSWRLHSSLGYLSPAEFERRATAEAAA
jgi:transposase InsO family protein